MREDEIVSLEYYGQNYAYDLEVDNESHTFFANDISVSNSHAISYGILSYVCAWLLNYYEAEWLCAYLENESQDQEKRIKAISEIKSFGYEIIKPDINYSSNQWSIIPNEKKFAQSLTSVKGLGEAAFKEIITKRPYKDVYDLIWDEKSKWKHSKLNIRNFGNLIKIGAFNSLNCVGAQKLFCNPKHMYFVLVDNVKELKKKNGRENFENIRLQSYGMEDWTNIEKISFQQELLGEFDLDLLISNEIQKVLADKGALPIDECAQDGIYWFYIRSLVVKPNKNGKNFGIVDAVGKTGTSVKVYVWDIDKFKESLKNGVIYISKIEKNDSGFLQARRGSILKM